MIRRLREEVLEEVTEGVRRGNEGGRKLSTQETHAATRGREKVVSILLLGALKEVRAGDERRSSHEVPRGYLERGRDGRSAKEGVGKGLKDVMRGAVKAGRTNGRQRLSAEASSLLHTSHFCKAATSRQACSE